MIMRYANASRLSRVLVVHGSMPKTFLSFDTNRYGGKKLERARDLFEQCLEGCPPEHCKAIYLLYAKLEEQHGMARHAMAVYERAAEAAPKGERFAIYNVYLRKAAEIYGVTRTRQVGIDT